MSLYNLLYALSLLCVGVMVGVNIPVGETADNSYVEGTPTYAVGKYVISFKESDDYERDSRGYIRWNNSMVIKSGQSLDMVDRICVHEVSHHKFPERTHPDDSMTDWFWDREMNHSERVCDRLTSKLVADSDKYLREG